MTTSVITHNATDAYNCTDKRRCSIALATSGLAELFDFFSGDGVR